MDILVTNDDGYDAPGLHALAEELEKLGRVWVFAPDAEKSTCSHSLTLHDILRVTAAGPERHFRVSGTPADCVFVALGEFVPQATLVVSGINRGANLANDVAYSGTVAGAREGCFRGRTSIAISRLGSHDRWYAEAARACLPLIGAAAERGLPPNTLLNINVPGLPPTEIKAPRLARLGGRDYGNTLSVQRDPRGRKYYWIGGDQPVHEHIEGSDCTLVDAGHIAVTPLRTPAACPDGLRILEEWKELRR